MAQRNIDPYRQILDLSEFIENSSDPDSPFQAKAYLRISPGATLESSSAGKKRKLDEVAILSTSGEEAPSATEQKAKDSIRIVFDLVEKDLVEFCTLVRTLKLSCSLKECTSEHEVRIFLRF